MPDYVEKVIDAIRDSVAKISDVKAAYLFGSYAKGEANEDSDLDIYVIVDDSTRDTIEIGAKIRKSLYKKHRLPLDLLVGKESVFNTRKNQITIESIIAREGILLYGN